MPLNLKSVKKGLKRIQTKGLVTPEGAGLNAPAIPVSNVLAGQGFGFHRERSNW